MKGVGSLTNSTRSSQRLRTLKPKSETEKIVDISDGEEITEVSRKRKKSSSGSFKSATRSSQRIRMEKPNPENEKVIDVEGESHVVSLESMRKESSSSVASETSLLSENEDVELLDDSESEIKTVPPPNRTRKAVVVDEDMEQDARFVGEPVADEEARRRWPKRYQGKVYICFFLYFLIKHKIFCHFHVILKFSFVKGCVFVFIYLCLGF